MAQFGRKTEGFVASRAVKIIHADNVDNYTVYVIEITLGQYKWKVRHRYSEFYELHEKLVSQYKLDKGLLPPKKLFGNQSESFIKKRQGELETYLQTVLLHLSELPVALVHFLEFNKYEIHGLAQVLAEDLYHKGDLILQAGEVFHITPLELHAITARLKLPEPTCESGDSKKDLGHVLDFITRVTALKIQGTAKLVGTSNINMNDLPFELANLKSLQSLELHNCNPEKISGVDHLKKMLKKIHIHHSVKAMKDILLVDVGFGQWTGAENESVLVPAWSALTSADFSHNAIISIDQSVKLMPKVEYIDLSHNQLDSIQELQNLSSLTHLDLSYNRFHRLDSLHTRLGNIKSMNLAGNKLESLAGLSKLYSLETLNVSHNEISQVIEVRHVSCLPCLERLILSGNPVTIVLDYRTKILELFGDRAREVCLDNTRATQKELDTVAILLAIQKSKDSKDKQKKHSSKKPAKEVEIAEAPSTIASQSEPSQGTTSTLPIYPPTSSTSALDTVTSLPFPDNLPDSPADLAPDLYRVQVLKLRQLGGAAWLNLLNQMHQRGPPHLTAQRSLHSDTQTSTHSDPASRNKLGHQYNFQSQVHSDSTSPMMTFHPPLAQFMLPETLPSRNDSTLISVLQSLLPDTHALTRLGGVGSEDPHREERPVHLIWCTAIGYTQPFREFPAGIFITTENVHIFEVRSLRGAGGMPVLEHVSCVPLMNIQQIVLGYESQYIRIEEAFVGPQGTFAFLMANTKKADLFLDSLKLAYRRAVPDLDQYEDPHIVVNGETAVNLNHALNQFEGIEGDSSSIQMMLYMLVHTVDFSHREKVFTMHSLVITSSYLYLLKEDYILWPQPTFAIGPSTRPQFDIASVFPIMGRITGIQMYDSDTYSPDKDTSLSQNFSSMNSSAMVVPNFIGYGVKLTFGLGGELGNQDLDIRVPTSGMRDKFLATLTQVRKDISEKYPNPPKVRSKAKARNVEPDSASSSSTSSSGKKSKPKFKKKVPLETSNNNNSKMNSDSSEEFVIAPELPVECIRPDSLSYVDPMYVLDQGVGDLELGHQASGSSGTPDPGDLSQRESPTGQSTSTLESVSIDRSELSTKDTHLELPPVPQIRRTPPPSTLGVIYPSMQLLGHLTVCNESMPLLVPLSSGMRNLACSTGEEILNFFHNNIAEISTENEELRHIMWTAAVPYICPNQEIPTCILLSTRALYFVSDITPKVPRKMTTLIKQPWKSHSRNKSDSYSFSAGTQVILKESEHHTSGILHGVHGSKKGQGVVRSYHIMPLKSMRQVQVGMLDQSVRLTGMTPEQTYCCVTRDNNLTSAFIKYLMSCLSHIHPTPSPDLNSSDSEQDFYKMFTEYNRMDHTEYTHPSKVKFCYPSEDSVADYTYQIKENIRGQKPKGGDIDLLIYLLVLQVDEADEVLEIDVGRGKPRTLLMTSHHIALAIEDHVSYPIPDFSISLPDAPQLAIQAIVCLELLKRVVVSDFTSHDLTLVFADEQEDINVDTSVDYYSQKSGAVAKRSKSVPEKTWTLIIQNLGDKDKLIKAITRQWIEFHPDGELSVQVSS